MKRRADKKGRSKGSLGSFVAVERYLLNSNSWLDLKPLARACYIELASAFTGSNNGKIAFSSRIMAKRLGVGKATASRAIAELEVHGFVETAQPSSFQNKIRLAAEYRLTAFKCDKTGELASKNFMRWMPQIQKTVPPVRPYGSTHETVAASEVKKQAPRFHQRYREGKKSSANGITSEPLLYSSHVVAASDTAQHGRAGAPVGSAVARPATAQPSPPLFLCPQDLPSLDALSLLMHRDFQSWEATKADALNEALTRLSNSLKRQSHRQTVAA